MLRTFPLALVAAITIASHAAVPNDWRQFRGPNALGIITDRKLTTERTADKTVASKLKLPGAGASSPITLGNRVFVTCYSGYGMDNKNPGDMKNLKRHLLCVDRKKGEVLWAKQFDAML